MKTSGCLPARWTCEHVVEHSLNTPYPQLALPSLPLPLSLHTTLPFSSCQPYPFMHLFTLSFFLKFTSSTLHLCSVERYTDPSNKTLNISKVNMKHAMSKKMDRFITTMTQLAGLRTKVRRCTTCVHVGCLGYWGKCM